MIQQVQTTNQSPNEVGFGFDAQQCIDIYIKYALEWGVNLW